MAETTPPTPKSTGLKSSEGKLALGGLVATIGPLLLDAFSGQDGAITLTETQENILLVGVVVVIAAYIISRGLAKTENR